MNPGTIVNMIDELKKYGIIIDMRGVPADTGYSKEYVHLYINQQFIRLIHINDLTYYLAGILKGIDLTIEKLTDAKV